MNKPFIPKEIPIATYRPNVQIATNIPEEIFDEHFIVLANEYKLNQSELLRQMVYFCLRIEYEPKSREEL